MKNDCAKLDFPLLTLKNRQTMSRLLRFLSFPLCLFAVLPSTHAQQPAPVPDLDGYVSSINSPLSFQADGRNVELKTNARYDCSDPEGFPLENTTPRISLGDHLLIFGPYDRKTETFHPKELCTKPWRPEKVAGAAVLEQLSPDGKLLRVDGRVLRLETSSIIRVEAPLKSVADAKINDWVQYTASFSSDGGYTVHEVTISRNMVSPLEQELRNSKFVTFTAPDTAGGHAGEVKFAHLARSYALPPDAALSERLTRVGGHLIPAYQKSLAPNDPVRIDFRFYPIHGIKAPDCIPTPNGSIFVPTQVTDRLVKDDDLAAVLANCVAALIEKQSLYLAPKMGAANATFWGGQAAGAFIPGVGLATIAGTAAYSAHEVGLMQQQADRVSLDLLEEAGLSPQLPSRVYEEVQPKHETIPSGHVQYLYRALAERQRAHGMMLPLDASAASTSTRSLAGQP
jgi:hypothetical protein